MDREKVSEVIKGLECCSVNFTDCVCGEEIDECPYCGTKKCIDNLMRDALELLKAQEPVKPYAEYCEHTGTKWLVCGACHEPMNKTSEETWSNYCPNCGRAVKW